jgi:hypothetical protein
MLLLRCAAAAALTSLVAAVAVACSRFDAAEDTDATQDGASNEAEQPGADADAGCPPPSTATPCADTDRNPRHCGACGHDCLGGACESGVCLPTTVAAGLSAPIAVVVDRQSCGRGKVFWATRGCEDDAGYGAIHVAEKDGGDARVIATAQCMLDLAADETHVVWGAYDQVGAARIEAEDVHVVSSFPGNGAVPSGYLVSVAAGQAWWGSTFGFALARHPLDQPTCAEPACLVVGVADHLRGIAATRTGVFWSTRNGAVWFSNDAGPGATLANGEKAELANLIVAGDALYWLSGAIRRYSPAGGTVTILFEDAKGLVVHGGQLFWTIDTPMGGEVRTSNLDGRNVQTIARGQISPSRIAADDVAVYWVNRGTTWQAADGRVMKLAR